MEKKAQPKINFIKVVQDRIRNDLFLYSLKNYLSRFGFDFDPYYLEREGLHLGSEPKIRDTKRTYTLEYISAEEIGKLNNVLGMNFQSLKKDVENGLICIGLKHQNEIAALTFVKLGDFVNKNRLFKIRDNEAYLLNMYTFESFRGMNLAPYLRYHNYRLLRERGYDHILSITSSFNSSSLRFKEKLGAQHIAKYLYVGLFKKYHFNFHLKNYSQYE